MGQAQGRTPLDEQHEARDIYIPMKQDTDAERFNDIKYYGCPLYALINSLLPIRVLIEVISNILEADKDEFIKIWYKRIKEPHNPLTRNNSLTLMSEIVRRYLPKEYRKNKNVLQTGIHNVLIALLIMVHESQHTTQNPLIMFAVKKATPVEISWKYKLQNRSIIINTPKPGKDETISNVPLYSIMSIVLNMQITHDRRGELNHMISLVRYNTGVFLSDDTTGGHLIKIINSKHGFDVFGIKDMYPILKKYLVNLFKMYDCRLDDMSVGYIVRTELQHKPPTLEEIDNSDTVFVPLDVEE